jgi:hypothetical protein
VDQFYVAPINATAYAYGFNFTLSNTYHSILDVTNYSSYGGTSVVVTSSTGLSFILNKGDCIAGIPRCSGLQNSTDVQMETNPVTNSSDRALPYGASGNFFGAFTYNGQFAPSMLNVTFADQYCTYSGCAYVPRWVALSSGLPTATHLSWLNSSQVQIVNAYSSIGAIINVQLTGANSTKMWFPSTPSLLLYSYAGPPPFAASANLAKWLGYPNGCSYWCGSEKSVLVIPGEAVAYYITVFSWGSYESNGSVPRYTFHVDSVTPPTTFVLKSGPSGFPIILPSAAVLMGQGCGASLAYDFIGPSNSYGTYMQPYLLSPWVVTWHTEPATNPTNVTTGFGQNYYWSCGS